MPFLAVPVVQVERRPAARGADSVNVYTVIYIVVCNLMAYRLTKATAFLFILLFPAVFCYFLLYLQTSAVFCHTYKLPPYSATPVDFCHILPYLQTSTIFCYACRPLLYSAAPIGLCHILPLP